LKYCKRELSQDVSVNAISGYLTKLSKNREEWLVHQASDAIHLYFFQQRRKSIRFYRHKAQLIDTSDKSQHLVVRPVK
jgi:hypothetical protein